METINDKGTEGLVRVCLPTEHRDVEYKSVASPRGQPSPQDGPLHSPEATEFPTLSAAASIPRSKRGLRRARLPIPEFRLDEPHHGNVSVSDAVRQEAAAEGASLLTDPSSGSIPYAARPGTLLEMQRQQGDSLRDAVHQESAAKVAPPREDIPNDWASNTAGQEPTTTTVSSWAGLFKSRKFKVKEMGSNTHAASGLGPPAEINPGPLFSAKTSKRTTEDTNTVPNHPSILPLADGKLANSDVTPLPTRRDGFMSTNAKPMHEPYDPAGVADADGTRASDDNTLENIPPWQVATSCESMILPRPEPQRPSASTDGGSKPTNDFKLPAIFRDRCTAFPEDSANGQQCSNSKKSLNVDSPSFTPAQLGGKKSAFSTNATPFTPRGTASNSATPSVQQETAAPSLFASSAPFTEFAPQNNYDLNTAGNTNGSADSGSIGYDPFTMSNVTQALQSAQFNPYAEEHNPLAGTSGSSFYSAQSNFSGPSQPLQYHLYYPIASVRENLQPFQRHVHDFFLPESIRADLQKKSEAARQVLASQPGVQLPTLQQYHSLVPLDTRLHNTTSIFGLPTWVWKATSRKNGNIFCLRRIEGFRLTSEEAIKPVSSWKKIIHPNIVTTVEAFTTRDFNDSSLIFVHSYHPLSKTLAEHHFPPNRYGRMPPVPEKVLWGYLTQLASALKTIHRAKLAARCVDITKVVLTDKDRVRLSACSILDVLHFEAHRRIEDLQQEDFFNLGKLILSIASNTLPKNMQDLRLLLDQLGRHYSPELKERITWLLTPSQPLLPKTAEQLVFDLSQHLDDLNVASLNAFDEAMNQLGKELENGRLVRLMVKLGTINERPEHDGDPNWSETDQRYTLKLFRDYVFHQVDAQGNPVVDLGHVISCLNKLDAGVEERIYLTSRDHQSTFVVSYRELKKQVQNAFGDLTKGVAKQQTSVTGRGY
ncbi:hypothetical protein GGR56DRAFT_468741 [Xylariaceae sp. FL0804]|nr:hypothetical protein GGR56DRAFT_468741 [Xylariaceae sp. FL0804]